MKAWVLRGNNDIYMSDVPKPEPKPGEVLIQVKAVGICSSDIARVYTNGAYHYPIILGHEFSGVTQDGRRVGVFPLLPCHQCESCKSGYYETCSNYSYLGSRQNGAFAEYVAVHKWNLISLPDDISFETAALLEPAAVAHHAVKSIQNHNISKAVVIGNGAIGKLIGAWLKHYSIELSDVLGRNDKNNFMNYEVCFEAVGSAEAFKRCIELVKPNGEIILVGNPNADFSINQKLYWQILRKQILIKGVWNSSFKSDWQQAIECAHEIKLGSFISHRFAFEMLDKALDMMRGKKEKYEKVVLV